MRDAASGRGTRLSGFRRYTWWAVTGGTVFVLPLFVGDRVLDTASPPALRALFAAALAATVLACAVLLGRRLAAESPPLPVPWLLLAACGAAVLGAIPLWQHDYGEWPIAPALVAAIGAAFLRGRPRLALIVTAAALAPLPGGLLSLAADDGRLLYAALFPLGVTGFALWVTLGPLWAWDLADRLARTRGLLAELAVKDERLRFAADLHDVQGHHLQVIALKSELASRLVEVDPARAAAEMREVRETAARALGETRSLVHGYRRTALGDEMANAAKVLAAADIDARMRLGEDVGGAGLSEPARHLLGLVMRETVTNVLRHSRAGSADVEYAVADGVANLKVGNDGAAERPGADAGSGLRVLAERLRAAGGGLTWSRTGDRFTVSASLPVDADPAKGPR
ncbi:sensor histidine kinase [Glycomyces paridis]|uniref:Histidine kinase n=1 Tax=Glycomyces paridis TaxID=2126555 RepID=A0A4S8P3N8_9ACTN|nr:histidine kinase [Glycomyces paridis]THV23502.1 histidine kinase [Glycomyces paridis]